MKIIVLLNYFILLIIILNLCVNTYKLKKKDTTLTELVKET